MIIALEGFPGAGKSTALSQLEEGKDLRIIGEIIDQEPDGADVDFYVRNDIRKYDMVDPSRINLMDRNFVSTLCYNHCSDEQFGTNKYPRAKAAIDSALLSGSLRQPDMYIVLMCSIATSRSRQSSSNAPAWGNEAFLKRAHNFYTEYFARQTCPVLIIDTDRTDISRTADRIKSAIATMTEKSPRLQVQV